MWGADDPDPRKPMVWDDLQYDDEAADPFGRPRARNRVAPDTAMFRLYQELIALRTGHLALFAEGEMTWLMTDDQRGLLAYRRRLDDQEAMVAFNLSASPQDLELGGPGRYRLAFPSVPDAGSRTGPFRVRLNPKDAMVWIRE